MTSSDSWKNAENYNYLTKLEGRHYAAGWAWEFIRRSQSYREAFAGFIPLRDQHGATWRNKQPRDKYFPPMLAGESENGWKLRVSGLGYDARAITASQLAARGWMLGDLYDPDKKYDGDQVHFIVRNPFPAFYASQRDVEIPSIGPFEDLNHDYAEAGDHILYVAFDATRPYGDQLEKTRIMLDQFGKRYDSKKSPSKGQSRHWVTYLGFLDARDADPEKPLIEILNTLNVEPQRTTARHELASQRYESARLMTTKGYKGLLHLLETH